MTNQKILEQITQILMDILCLDQEEVFPGATLVDDLGASSIDFVDINFAVQKQFDIATNDMNFITLAEKAQRLRFEEIIAYISEKHPRVPLDNDYRKSFEKCSISSVIARLKADHHLEILDDEQLDITENTFARIKHFIESFGFSFDDAHAQEIKAVITQKDEMVYEIFEKIMQIYTVEVLVTYVSGKHLDEAHMIG